MPRMEPPPSSLEAMVRKQPGLPRPPAPSSHWLWLALLVVTIGIIMYYAALRP